MTESQEHLVEGHIEELEMNKDFSLYRSQWPTDDATVLAQTITESIHEGLDGWTDSEKEVINRYLIDISNACAASK